MQRRHYEFLVEVIREFKRAKPDGSFEQFVEHLALAMKRQNPAFKPSRFYAALDK
jgi:hypothetical protein